jgi:hypothetical protein
MVQVSTCMDSKEEGMLYYMTWKRRAERLYRSRRDAALLLTRFKGELEGRGQRLVDYLLLPLSFEALIYSPVQDPRYEQVPSHLELELLAHLGRMGEKWPLSGTFELFNRSACFAELGKSGSDLVSYPLSQIIEEKLRLFTILDDEIA